MATINELSKIFLALQNRALDQSLVSQYNAQPSTEVISAVIGTDNITHTNNPRAFVESLYKNLLGKEPGDDVEGINYWVGKMTANAESNTPALTPTELLQEFLQEVQRYEDAVNAGKATITVTDAEGKPVEKPIATADATALKIFATKMQISTETAEKVGGDVDAFYLTFGAGLTEVTQGNIETAKETIDKEVASVAERYPVSNPGATGTLTTENPNFDASNGATDKDDVINALVDGTNSTLQASSNIDAGAGNDTLKVQMKNDFNGLNASGSIVNVENIELTNTTAQNLSFNAKGIGGVRTYTINGDTNGNSVNLQDVAYQNNLEVRLSSIKSTDGTTIGFDADKSPTNGNLSLRLSNVGTDTDSHNIGFDGISNVQVYLAGGNNYANLTGSDVSKISVGGSGNFKTDLGANVSYFNAASTAGKMTVDASVAQGSTSAKLKTLLTGSGNDNVTVDVNRLERTSVIDLGTGQDTLKFTGNVTDTTRQYFNLASVENLVFGTGTGVFSLDLGTTSLDSFGNETATNNRSANLKSITIEDGASVNIKELGNKNLNLTYNNASASAETTLDHAGTTNLILKAAGASSANGSINLSDTTSLNINVEGEGFSGKLSAAKATTLNINNNTSNKMFSIAAAATGQINDFKSVTTLKINSESTVAGNSVDLSQASFGALNTATLAGKGNIALGNITNSGGLTVNGGEYTGDFTIGNVNAGTSTLNITTAGKFTAGTLQGGNVTINLAETNATHQVGAITLNGTGSSLTYSTGTQGTSRTAGGSVTNHAQEISIAGQRTSITLNGKEGNDAFDITAGANTNTITLAGNLGTGNNQVAVDLSRANGVKLDVGRLQSQNNSEEGVHIQVSQGKDTITLAKDANKDVIAVNAGGTIAARQEEVTITGLPTLKEGNTVTFAGLTFTAKKAGGTTAAELAAAIVEGLAGNLTSTNATNFDKTGTLSSTFGSSAGSGVIWHTTATNSGAVLTIKGVDNTDINNSINPFPTFTGMDVPKAVPSTSKITVTDGATGSKASITVDFSGVTLTAGQSYTFANKTVTADAGATLTAANIASAFKGDTVSGATVTGNFNTIGGYTLTVESSSTFKAEAPSNGTTDNTALAGLKTAGVTLDGPALSITLNQTHTKDGIPSNLTPSAQSYVTLSGTGAAIKVDQSHLDTITNFQVGVDKVSLQKVDGTVIDVGTSSNIASGITGVTIANGVATFAATVTTLGAKLDAIKAIANDKMLGFQDGSDFYLVLGGGAGTEINSNDTVIKLAGVSGITDLAQVVA